MKIYFLIRTNDSEFTGISRYIKPFVNEIRDRIDLVLVRNVPMSFIQRLDWAGLSIPSLLKEFFVKINPQPEVGSILYISDQTLGACLLWRRYEKVMVGIHDLASLTQYNIFGTLRFGLLDKIFNSVVINSAKKADIIVTFSQFTKKEILKYLGCLESKIRVIYPGVGKEFVYRPLKKSGTDILYVGSEEPRKNLELLIRAFARMKQQNNKLRLIKVGRSRWGPGRVRIKALIRSLGLSQDIIFKEYVDDIVSVYNAADIFVFPSLYEGFGSPLVEAMACGLPVVCSNAASLPELAGDAAVMFDPHNEYELAEKVLEILESPQKQIQMKEQGFERAKLFSWEKHVQAILDLCQQLLIQL